MVFYVASRNGFFLSERLFSPCSNRNISPWILSFHYELQSVFSKVHKQILLMSGTQNLIPSWIISWLDTSIHFTLSVTSCFVWNLLSTGQNLLKILVTFFELTNYFLIMTSYLPVLTVYISIWSGYFSSVLIIVSRIYKLLFLDLWDTF